MDGKVKSFKLKGFLMPLITAAVLFLVLFLPAGSLRYWEGWIWWSVTFIVAIFITTYFSRKSPEFIARRSQYKEKDQAQKIPSLLGRLNLFVYLIPGLDFRFHWSAVPFWVVIAANVIVFLGFVLIFLVFKENNYASTIIEVADKQPVITTGPYSVVRHPMYTGMLLMTLFTPLALGSYWALIPAFLFFIPFLVLRIKGEEQTLLRDLPGYRDYCTETRYRLIPLIW